MLYEFEDQHKKVIELLTHCKKIVENSDIDNIDLSEFDIDPVELASNCFVFSGLCIPSERTALRDAYDFVVSHTRLKDLYGHDRQFYYSRASNELQSIMDRLEHLKASLTTLVLNAKPSK